MLEDEIITSLDIIEIVSALEDEFDISISMEYIQPKYFQSMDTIWEMIEELQ